MTGVLTTLVWGIVLSVLSGSYHMAAIMKFFNSGEYDFLMSLVLTIGEFSLHNPFNMRLYQKQIEIEREQEQHVPCLYF